MVGRAAWRRDTGSLVSISQHADSHSAGVSILLKSTGL